eukprot:CAMPEP_0198234688 /NCGR_PEP_ID=MMETSP1446-20131203/642_1 /TAXON_ID=1461542 ORGANISM="Unidentified sp, Strain CCMP2111" /NCGR_SAMPLE_ID=MMETSP1446 /ASSEMBLY_ACC=CAM_ASM_001112 /LENGTH=857 /DNA_ID=CAMNT_0043915509 /DNA_START=15 /DNA_END=2588 /DNA_ORIENTATION=-
MASRGHVRVKASPAAPAASTSAAGAAAIPAMGRSYDHASTRWKRRGRTERGCACARRRGLACKVYFKEAASMYAQKVWDSVGGEGTPLASISSKLNEVRDAVQGYEEQFQNSGFQKVLSGAGEYARDFELALQETLAKNQDKIASAPWLHAAPSVEGVAIAAASVFGVKAFLDIFFKGPEGDVDELPVRYDPETAEKYFSKRKGIVLKRVLEILIGSGGFFASIKLENDEGGLTEEVRGRQAVQLRDLVSKLGPTFVKVGQALSIRVDLLPEVYLKELRTLQDRVPPFSNEDALMILNREFNSKGGVDAVFSYLSDEPVASASLGQVYKGKLRDSGKEVAVKVQRPNILPEIALDLYILRKIAPIFQRFKNLNSDLVALVDEWGSRFVAELDYIREAENGHQFIKAMEARKITSVTSAEPVFELCTQKVLTTNWVNGERLELSEAQDVAKLCGIALTAYLTMLLDTGILHADPHPGNLLRTEEGQLCIIDWGLTTEISQDKQYAIIDYIAHLVAEDYTRIPQDLVSLGFIPPGKEEAVDDQGVVRALSAVFRNLAGGGGLKGINVSDVAGKVQYIQGKYGNIFQIPAYFAYILRAFSVLEGIGLQNDSKYRIVRECYPYIARRLFSDNTPRVRSALRAIMYEASPIDGQPKLNVRRFAKLASAFGTYTDQSVSLMPKQPSEEARSEGGISEVDATIIKEAASLLFSVEGNYLQELVLRETARTMDTLGRQTIKQGFDFVFGNSVASAIPASALNPAMKKQMEVLLAPLVAKSDDDEVVLETAQAVWEMLQPQVSKLLTTPPSGIGNLTKARGDVQEILPEFSEIGPGVAATVIRFNAALFERVMGRIGLDPDNASKK